MSRPGDRRRPLQPPHFVRYAGFMGVSNNAGKHFELRTKILPIEEDPGNAQWKTGRVEWIAIGSDKPNFKRPSNATLENAATRVTNIKYSAKRAIQAIESRRFPIPTLEEYRSQTHTLPAGSVIMGSTAGTRVDFKPILEHIADYGVPPPQLGGITSSLVLFARPKWWKRHPKIALAAAGAALAAGTTAIALKLLEKPESVPAPQQQYLPVPPHSPTRPAPKNFAPHASRPQFNLKKLETPPKNSHPKKKSPIHKR